jgi:hypothetical protein
MIFNGHMEEINNSISTMVRIHPEVVDDHSPGKELCQLCCLVFYGKMIVECCCILVGSAEQCCSECIKIFREFANPTRVAPEQQTMT